MSDSAIPVLSERRVDQIGILVRHLTPAMEAYSRLWGIAQWRVWDYDNALVPEMTYRGNRADFSIRIALSSVTPQIELIEWRRGACLFQEWALADRFGPHHVGVYVPSVRQAADEMRAYGLESLQSGVGYGVDGDGGFVYFDTESALGVILELIELPQRRHEPLFVYPESPKLVGRRA